MNEPISSEKYFYTNDGKALKSIEELEKYLDSCSEQEFHFHVNSSRNDFAAWINGVFAEKELSASFATTTNLHEAANVLKRHLSRNNPENISKPENKQQNVDVSMQHTESSKPSEVRIQDPKTAILEEFMNPPEMLKKHEENVIIKSEDNNPSREGASGIKGEQGDRATSTLSSSITSPPSSPPASSQASSLSPLSSSLATPLASAASSEAKNTDNNSGFREHTDEELEKYVQFAKRERPAEEPTEKAEYLKSTLQQLNEMISEIRRHGKDALIPGLMMRMLTSKMEYYNISKKDEDYSKMITIINEIGRELEYIEKEEQHSFADDILRTLEVQMLAMRKI